MQDSSSFERVEGDMSLPAQKILCQLDQEGFFLGTITADESPLERGVYLIPGGAITDPPPEKVLPGMAYRFVDGVWRADEDHRQACLYRVSDGTQYLFGQAGHEDDAAYFGVGPVPDWLTSLKRPDVWSVWSGTAWERDGAAWIAAERASVLTQKNQRIAVASVQIAILQDAMDLGVATTAEERVLQEWRTYRIAVARVDASAVGTPEWPAEPKIPNPPA